MTSKFYRNLSIIIAIIGAITGIICGFVFKTVNLEHPWREPSFNFILMFSVWIATAALDFLYIGIYEILLNQEIIYRKLSKLSDTNNS